MQLYLDVANFRERQTTMQLESGLRTGERIVAIHLYRLVASGSST